MGTGVLQFGQGVVQAISYRGIEFSDLSNGQNHPADQKGEPPTLTSDSSVCSSFRVYVQLSLWTPRISSYPGTAGHQRGHLPPERRNAIPRYGSVKVVPCGQSRDPACYGILS